MKKVHRILILCDFSQCSGKVLKYTAGIAEQMSVGLIVVNVNNQIEVETIKAAVRLSEIIKQAIYLDEYISKTKESRLQQIHKLIEGTSCSQLVIKELVQRI